jgi:hypothetical protein
MIRLNTEVVVLPCRYRPGRVMPALQRARWTKVAWCATCSPNTKGHFCRTDPAGHRRRLVLVRTVTTRYGIGLKVHCAQCYSEFFVACTHPPFPDRSIAADADARPSSFTAPSSARQVSNKSM